MTPRILSVGGVTFVIHTRTLWICLALCVAILMLGIGLLGSGTLRLSPLQVVNAFWGSGDDTAQRIIRRIRVPRLLTAACVGASLGIAGAVFQSISRNILGSPDIIGFTTGAATGALTQIILFNAGPLQTAVAAVVGGLITAAVVLVLSRGQGSGGYRLILIGIGVGAVLAGVNTLLMVKGDLDRATSAQIWLAGSLNARNWSHVWPVAVGLLIGTPILVMLTRSLSLLEMGDDLAHGLGVRPRPTRFVAVLLAVGLSSAATAATGPIAFIALAGPQIARRLTKTSGMPVISAGLTGAVLLMGADLMTQRMPLSLNLPIGLSTGLLGGLYLLYVLLRNRRY